MNQNDWERASGVICPECKLETLRIIEGLCPQCHQDKIMERDKKIEDKSERRYYKGALREGTISLSQMKEGR